MIISNTICTYNTNVYASLIAIRPCWGEHEFILQVMHNEPQLRCGWPFNSTKVIYQKGLHILHESSINLPSQVVSSLEEESLLLLCFFIFCLFFCFRGEIALNAVYSSTDISTYGNWVVHYRYVSRLVISIF